MGVTKIVMMDMEPPNKGPDQILEASSYVTTDIGECVKLRAINDADNIPPISIPSMLIQAAKESPNPLAMSIKGDGVWIKWTYSEYLASVRCISRAFIKLGLKPREAVAVLGFNSPEWFISDLAAIFCGSVGVGIYPTNSPEATKYVLLHSRASIIVVENDLQLQKILQIREDLKDIKAIIQYTGKSSEAYYWDDVMKMGNEAMDLDIKVDERLSAIGTNQCCQLVYTSGTTGLPKAVMLSHDNISFAARSVRDRYNLRYKSESIVSYLPLSHIAAFVGDIITIISC